MKGMIINLWRLMRWRSLYDYMNSVLIALYIFQKKKKKIW